MLMKKMFLFAAAFILAVSMNLRAETPANVRVMQLVAELGYDYFKEQPMPNTCMPALDEVLAKVSAAEEEENPDWEALYIELKGAIDDCTEGIAFYADVFLPAIEDLQAKIEAAEGTAAATDAQAVLKAATEAYENGTVATGATAEIAKLLLCELNPQELTGLIPNYDFSQPVDSTNWIVTAPTGVTYEIAEPAYNYSGNFLKATGSKKFAGYTVEQTVEGLPAGDYKLSATVYRNESGNYTKGTINLYANSKSVKVANSSANQGAVASVYVRVTSDGKLTIKLQETDNRNTEVCFGDIKLEGLGHRDWANFTEDETSYTANISCIEELDDAFARTDYEEGKAINFVLASGTYDLGVNKARNFPSNRGIFTIKAADNATPVITGSIRPGAFTLESLIIEGITFQDFTSHTDNSPLHLAKNQKDTIFNEVVIRNCSFKDMPACIIRLNAGNNAEKYIHSIVVENNDIDGIGHHLFQFAGGKNVGLASFTFRENTVKNMYATGGQFFNTPISPNHPAGDSIYTMTVVNNTFYKIGGMASTARNFLECNKDNDWSEVNLLFANNIFYDRYGWDKYAESNLALFNAKESQKVTVSFLKNVLAPIDVMANDALTGEWDCVSFPVTSGNIMPEYYPIPADTVGFWNDSTNLKLYTDSKWATAGVAKSYVGAKSTYIMNPAAGEKNPTDATCLIDNPYFNGNVDSWTISGNNLSAIEYDIKSGDYGFENNYIEAASAKKFQNYTIEQTLTNIPNGDYKFSAKVYYIEESNYGKGTLRLYANDKYSTVTKSSASGATVNSVYVRVTDNTLTIKMTETDNRNTIVAFGDPKLEYYNHRSWAKVANDSITATVTCYEEFIDALEFDGYKGEAIINVTGGEYSLGTAQRVYPNNLSKLTINGNGNKFYGAILNSKGGLNIDEIVINNVAFIGDGKATETAAPIVTQGNDKFGSVTFKNCSFTDLNDPLCRLRANSTVGKLAYEGCTITNQGAAVNGGNHTFIVNNSNQILKEFVLKENIFDNYQGKQFMQFANVKLANAADTMKVVVENNVFNNFYNGDGSNAENFLEGCKVANLDIYVANNFFWYDSIPASKRQPCQLNPGGSYTYYGARLLNNVYNIKDYEIFNLKDSADPDVEENLYLEDLGHADLVYKVGDKFFKTDKLFTAGTNGTYVGVGSMYYGFDVAEDGSFVVENLSQFDEAMAFDPKPANFTVQLKDNTDECGYYALGMNARLFPQNGTNLTFKAYEGNAPKVSGSFRSSNGMKVDTYLVEGINFVEGDMKGKTDASPLFFHKGIKDTVMNTVIVRNCTFTDMPACMIRINANGDTEKYIHKVLVENNVVDGINHHFFQFAGGKAFGVTEFTFRENIVKNMAATGGQFFNTPVSTKCPAGDSTYVMTVEHNTFYKIGGMSSSARNFLECNKDNNFKEVYFNIVNNIFYDRYGWDGYAESDLALFNASEGQTVEFNIKNNVLAPIDVMANDVLENEYEGVSFPVTSGNFKPAYDDNIAADTAAGFWADEAALTLYDDNAYYTAGLNGTYIGAAATYVTNPGFPEGTFYGWTSPKGTPIEIGGKAVHTTANRVNYSQAGYYTICLNGKKAELTKEIVTVTLNEALADGDSISITAFRNKNVAGKTANAYFSFENGATCDDGTDGMYFTNINKENGVDYDGDGETPNTKTFAVPAAAAGSKSFIMTRSQTGTNLFITKFAIFRKGASSTTIDGLDKVKNEMVIYVNNGVVYLDVNEASTAEVFDMVGRSIRRQAVEEGLNAIEGLNAGQIYIVRTGDVAVKVAL